MVDQQTILVDTSTPPTAWTRVTGVTESPTTITITVSTIALTLPVAQAETRGFITLTVTLRDPIGDRAVIDGSNGLPVRQLACEAGQSGWGCMTPSPTVQPTPTDTADTTLTRNASGPEPRARRPAARQRLAPNDGGNSRTSSAGKRCYAGPARPCLAAGGNDATP